MRHKAVALLDSFCIQRVLDQAINRALAFLIVAIIYGIVAYVMFTMGKKRMQQVNLVPEQTVETIKEDAAWAKAQRS
jgi:hypothetical protein